MRFGKKALAGLFSAGLTLSLLALGSTTANAEGLADEIDTSGIIEVSADTPDQELIAQIDESLEALASVQSPEEIDDLRDLPNTIFLFDPVAGEEIAAVHLEPSGPQTRAISWLTPGCGTSGSDISMCITAGGSPYGYIGTGSKVVNLANVSYISSGNRNGQYFFSTGTSHVQGPGQGARITGGYGVNSIKRW